MEKPRFRLAPEPIHPYAQVHVQRVTQSEFKELQNIYPPQKTIRMDEYIQSLGDEILLNHGAGPCTLLYIIDNQDQNVFASHLSTVNPAKSHAEIKRNFIKAQYLSRDTNPHIRLPSQHEVGWFSQDKIDGNFSTFCEMEDEVRTYIKNHDPSHIEAHVFGQNICYYPTLPFEQNFESICDTRNEQLLFSLRLQSLGLDNARIVDYRTLTADRTDNTLYVPYENRIYHYSHIYSQYNLTTKRFKKLFEA